MKVSSTSLAASWRAVTSGPAVLLGPLKTRRKPFGPCTVRSYEPFEYAEFQVSETVLPASVV